MTTKVHTVRYVITNQRNQFLTDLFHGKPQWSVAPHDCITTGVAYLDLASAKAKCLEAQKVLGQPLNLALIDFCRVDGRWIATSQQGVPQ